MRSLGNEPRNAYQNTPDSNDRFVAAAPWSSSYSALLQAKYGLELVNSSWSPLDQNEKDLKTECPTLFRDLPTPNWG
jgi:hypothetical protein